MGPPDPAGAVDDELGGGELFDSQWISPTEGRNFKSIDAARGQLSAAREAPIGLDPKEGGGCHDNMGMT